MLDVLKLEKEWSKYHFKKMMPLYAISSLLVVTIASAAYYLTIINPNIIDRFQEPIVEHSSNITTKAVEKSAPVAPSIYIYEQNKFIPSYDFLNSLSTEYINYNNAQKLAALALIAKDHREKEKRKKALQKKKKHVQKRKVAKKRTHVVPKKMSTLPPPTAQHIDNVQNPQPKLFKVANATSSDDEINSVIKRFNRNKKPALSLFIAKKYYAKGNYKGAMKYAKETYKLNKKIDDANLVYAKSLVKLDQKDKAIQFLKQNSSNKTKRLLSDINKGTFQ